MKINLFFLFVLLAIPVCSLAQETELLKRDQYKLELNINRSKFFKTDIEPGPYVLPNKIIQLYPGESVYIEVYQENDLIKDIIAVKEIRDSTKTLKITFTQIDNYKIHESMVLEIISPFKKDLLYKAKIYVLTRGENKETELSSNLEAKWVDTNVHPVSTGRPVYETWPDMIISITLGNWEFQVK